MATITSGNNATGTFGTADSLTISTRGSARLEVPTGTTVAEFSGTRTLGPYTGQSYRITAVTGDLNYDFQDGSGPVADVTADLSTGALYANGSPVSGGRKRKSVVLKVGGQFNAPSAGTVGVTQAMLQKVKFGRPVGLKVHVLNVANVAQLGCKISAAVTNTAADPVTPTGTPNAVLFTANGITSQAFDTSAATVVTANNSIWTLKSSNMLPLRGADRVDGDGFLYAFRFELPAAGNTLGCRFADYAAAPLSVDVAGVRHFYKSGAFVTTPGGMTLANSTEWQAGMPIYVEYFLDDGASQLMVVHDSRGQGQDGSTNQNGPTRRVADALTDAGNPTAFFCAAHSSMTAAIYLANGLTWIAMHRPVVALFDPWSPNGQYTADDQYTQAGVDAAKAFCSQFIAACQAAGTKPALETPHPVNNINATQEGFRRQIVQYVKTVCAAGDAVLVDADGALTDYSTAVGGFKAGLFASDFHANEAGQTAVAAVMLQAVGPWLR